MNLSQAAARSVIEATPAACRKINEFTRKVLITRGGRIGSGMGSLLEALWGFFTNEVMRENADWAAFELGWFSRHGYNDFAVIEHGAHWTPESHEGELVRVEAKSMNAMADESKGHFDELVKDLSEEDLLLVLVWSWDPANDADKYRVYPHVRDHFVGPAVAIARLRDRLHLARGCSFVEEGKCPDKCADAKCVHFGEPLNAAGKRERLSGPLSCKPANVSYAANFGGLVRMLKTNSPPAKQVFRDARADDDVAHEYISFIHRNFPDEEVNQYSLDDWRDLARSVGVGATGASARQLRDQIKATDAGYQNLLRYLNRPTPNR